MEITEVKIFMKHDDTNKKLKAYATITIDNAFVIRNIKVIEGNKGLFVAMPSRKIKESCPKCGFKNAARSKFCNQCGANLPFKAIPTTEDERQAEHKDIAHPITTQCREYIQKKVLDAYREESARPSQGLPGRPQSQSFDRGRSAGPAPGTEYRAPQREDLPLPYEEDDKDLEL